MSKIPLIIFGASGHAKVIIDIAEKQAHWQIIGLIDSYQKIGTKVLGYEVIGGGDAIKELAEQYATLHCFIAIGDNHVRERIYLNLISQTPNLTFAKLVHPSAQIARAVSIGQGTVIMPGAVINSDTKIGNFVILNSNSCVEHDGTLADFCSLAPGAILGGNCYIGRSSAISIGATIKHGIRIGEHCVIGAGATVLQDIESNIIAYGTPAKMIRARQIGEKYL